MLRRRHTWHWSKYKLGLAGTASMLRRRWAEGWLATAFTTLLAVAWPSPAPLRAATAGCPPPPALSARTYDAAVAELKQKGSRLTPRRQTVHSARPLNTILGSPKSELVSGTCYATFTVSDGSLSKSATSAAVTDQSKITGGTRGTADGPATSSTPAPAPVTTPPPAPTPPAASPDRGTSDERKEALTGLAGAVIGAILEAAKKSPPDAEPVRPPSDPRPKPPPVAQQQPADTACPPLPKFAAETFDAARDALRQRRVRLNPVDRKSSLPRGTLLAPAEQTRGADGVCVVTLLRSDGTQVRVPALVGMRREQAHDAILAAGLLFDATEAPSSAAPGTVVAQAPAAQTEVDRGSAVRATVARPTDLQVPRVIGLQTSPAQQRLARFKVEPESVESARPAGEVVDQDPTPGTPRRPGESVRIMVSDGSLVEVPAVLQLTLDDARRELGGGGAGLIVSTTTRDDPTAPNTVVGQKPAAGAVVKRGSSIALEVSQGLNIPEVVGMQFDAARTQLSDFEVETQPVANTAPRGRVLEQRPVPGSRVAAGSAVTLQVSDGSLVSAPDVRTLTLEAARATLRSVELVAEVSSGPDRADALVSQQAPLPTAIVARASAVRLEVKAPGPSRAMLIAGALAVLVGAGVLAKFIRTGRTPKPPMTVDARIEFGPAPAQPDGDERTAPDIGVEVRLVQGETSIETTEREQP